jgi:hypothetical protein
MPWAGDWYLWSLFALHHDVAYFKEPMVCYREHGMSMTSQLTRTQAAACCEEEISIPWEIKRRADAAGFWRVSRHCLGAVSEMYARCAATRRFDMSVPILSLREIEESVRHNTDSEEERNWVHSRVFAKMGSEFYWQGDVASARRFYEAALRASPLMIHVLLKRILLSFGGAGNYLRSVIRSLRLGSCNGH